jgi:ketosteroid isomerase-like protein
MRYSATIAILIAVFLRLALGVMSTIGPGNAVMAGATDTEENNKRAIRAAFDAWRDGTGGIFDLLAEDATWTVAGNSPVSKTFGSRQEFMDVVVKPFNARLSSPLKPTVRGIYADEDMVIALWDGAGVARDGKPYKNSYAWFMRMRDGKILNVVAFLDTIEFTDIWRRITPQ